MTDKLFGQLIFLIILAIALFFGGTVALQEYRAHQLRQQLTELQQEAQMIQLNNMRNHVDRCLKQGHRGNGC